MVEESGVPEQDDWSIAPEDDRVRFSLSGVTSRPWGRDTMGHETSENPAYGQEGKGRAG